MGIKYEVIAAGEKYTDKKTGEEKTRWIKCGVVLEREDGSLSLKLETLPVAGFNGWLNLWVPKPKDGETAPRKDTGSKGAHAADFKDDIPW